MCHSSFGSSTWFHIATCLFGVIDLAHGSRLIASKHACGVIWAEVEQV